MAEQVEGARLLSEYRAESLIAGSNPALSAKRNDFKHQAAVAQLDRASVYGTEGRRFESFQPRQLFS